MSALSSKTNVVSAATIVQVTNTVNKVFHMQDSGDGEGFARCFAKNGASCTVEKANKTWSGEKELISLGMWLYNTFTVAKGCRHWEGNVYVTALTPEDAAALGHPVAVRQISYWKSLSGGDVLSSGTHEDILVPNDADTSGDDKEWVILTRIIRHTFSAT